MIGGQPPGRGRDEDDAVAPVGVPQCELQGGWATRGDRGHMHPVNAERVQEVGVEIRLLLR